LQHLPPTRERAPTSRIPENTTLTVDLTKEQAEKPLDLLHMMRVNTHGTHAVLEPIGKPKPK
jgi:hypothetical protein